ncbi:MAG TPA: B12-binding domain-containing protein [Pyrinomonadaceae bacterium]|nr:B12-binding domain-containing protein [Pyrinomonadaceae bacterium]
MATANLTTKEVARLLRVSEATVKRWADDGLLRSEKTVGGHRRFGIQAIARLRREQGMGPGSQPPSRTPRRTARKKNSGKPLLSPAVFTELLLRGDEGEAAAVLVDAYLHDHELYSLFDTTITEAMHRIGELWFEGTITVADEHLATRVLLSALQKLRSIVVPAEPTGLKAVCCGIEGDLHEVPIHLGEMTLEAEGWDARNLGPNTPLFALRDMVARKRPQLVCISARSIADLDRATAEYAQLRKVAAKLATAVVIGGEGFRDQTLRERFPSDFYAEDFGGLAKFVRALAKKKA